MKGYKCQAQKMRKFVQNYSRKMRIKFVRGDIRGHSNNTLHFREGAGVLRQIVP